MQINEFEKLILEHELLLAYYSTDTCNVCRVLKPRVQVLIGGLPPGQYEYLDTRQSPGIAGQYLIFAVPPRILFVRGREAYRLNRYFGPHELTRQLDVAGLAEG